MKATALMTTTALLALTAAAMAEPMKLEGTVTDVIGRRVVVESASGKVLVDLGPRAVGQKAVKTGDKIVVDGDMKRGDQLMARQVVMSGGETYVIRERRGWIDWLTARERAPAPGPYSAADAAKIAAGKGYTISGEPVADKRHYVAAATKDGKSYEIDIHRDGNVVAKPAFAVGDARKLATDKGYTLSGDPVRQDKHFTVSATKDGKPYELDIHRDGKVEAKAPFSSADARKLVSAKGYEIVGEPKREKEHFQMLGRKDGTYFAVDAHRDGNVKVVGAVDKSDIKWGPMIP